MSVVDEIKQRLDIVEIASGYLKLEKAGRNFKALCPFHSEKTPSFFIFPERQSWHCFGCGTGGDLLSFIMKKESLSFGEVLRLLAERAGVTLVQQQRASGEKTEAERLREVNEAAAQYYHSLLLDSPAAQEARDYLGRRGIRGETIKDFQLGFSPNSWDALQGCLLERGIERSEQLAAGLLVEAEGGVHDRFRNRLMYPIRDARGRVVGFGARALGDATPKYLNSPQTLIFDKGGILYALDRAKGAIRERNQVIFMEGYMDVIAAHQQGTVNAVATMGVALTEKHLSLLKGLTRNLVLALDPDLAGEEATRRGIEVARQAFHRQVLMPSFLGATSKLDADISVLSLPEGKDPDEIIRESPQAWQQVVENPQPLMDYLIETLTAKRDLSNPKEVSAACEQLLPILLEIGDDIQKELYLRKLARLVGVTERTLIGMAAKLQRTPKEKIRSPKSMALSPPPALSSGDRLESYCLSLLLQHPGLLEMGGELTPDLFGHIEKREIFKAWCDTPDPETLRQNLDINLRESFESLLAAALPPAEVKELELALADSIRRLKERRLRDLKAQEELLISEAESAEGGLEVAELSYALLHSMKDHSGETRGGTNEDSERLAALLQKGMEVNRELKGIFRERGSRKSKPQREVTNEPGR